MNLQDARSKKRISVLLSCSICLLLIIPGGVSSSGRTMLRHQSHIQQSVDAPQAEYVVILLPAPAQLTDSVGQGVGVGQSVGTGRIAGAPSPDETHAVLWPLGGGGPGIDLHPSGFRYSAALDTDGQRQVGSGNGPPTQFLRHALLWSGVANGYVDLHPSGIWTDSIARSIAGDQQVGNINFFFNGNESSPQSIIHAALWRGTAASVVDLHPTGIGCQSSYANATDGSHQVGYGYFPTSGNTTPYRALFWSGTAASAVVLHPPGFTHSFAEGVGGNEQVGYAYNTLQGDGYVRALLWRGTAASVVSLHPAGFLATSALATNGSQQVGFGGTPANPYQSHALRWSGTAASVVDLHALLPAEFTDGSSIAYDIDALGNITGLAQRPDGSTTAVLWRRASVAPNIAPSAQLISPNTGQLFYGTSSIQMIAQAADNDGSIAQVEFYVENRLVGTTSSGSGGNYQYNWPMLVRRPGKYRLRVRAIDNLGASTWSQTVIVRIIPG
jgi:hypothetical protein